MTKDGIDEKYYINVAEIMRLKTPRCRLQKPTLKPTILVTGWNEWLQIKGVDTGI
ncbi:hypothetical protein [Methanobrevibacter sp.]|uniref:hypothetical protein n=1 Tax=Methanobrevibacter sp. TaxID=66852 RepID=UPI00388EA1C7